MKFSTQDFEDSQIFENFALGSLGIYQTPEEFESLMI